MSSSFPTRNPFSTRHIQPGGIPYLFPEGESIETLAAKGTTPGKCYLIVGEHGSGKSSLLQSLAEYLRRQNPEAKLEVLMLQPHAKPVRTLWNSVWNWRSKESVLIDGFEQIPFPLRYGILALISILKLRCYGTSHRDYPGCVTIWRTKIDSEIERRVLDKLLESSPAGTVDKILQSEEWQQSRSRQKQNLRESLFDMYDWWIAYENDLR